MINHTTNKSVNRRTCKWAIAYLRAVERAHSATNQPDDTAIESARRADLIGRLLD